MGLKKFSDWNEFYEIEFKFISLFILRCELLVSQRKKRSQLKSFIQECYQEFDFQKEKE